MKSSGLRAERAAHIGESGRENNRGKERKSRPTFDEWIDSTTRVTHGYRVNRLANDLPPPSSPYVSHPRGTVKVFRGRIRAESLTGFRFFEPDRYGFEAKRFGQRSSDFYRGTDCFPNRNIWHALHGSVLAKNCTQCTTVYRNSTKIRRMCKWTEIDEDLTKFCILFFELSSCGF